MEIECLFVRNGVVLVEKDNEHHCGVEKCVRERKKRESSLKPTVGGKTSNPDEGHTLLTVSHFCLFKA